jgi:hypothetical protein
MTGPSRRGQLAVLRTAVAAVVVLLLGGIPTAVAVAAVDPEVHRSVDTHVNRYRGRSVDCAAVARAASSEVSDSEPGRPDGEIEMNIVSTPLREPSYADGDTLRLPLVTAPTADIRRATTTRPASPAARSSMSPGSGPGARHRGRRRARRYARCVLLMVATPEPLSYLGWIIGRSTAVAVVLPLLSGLPLATAMAVAVVNL